MSHYGTCILLVHVYARDATRTLHSLIFILLAPRWFVHALLAAPPQASKAKELSLLLIISKSLPRLPQPAQPDADRRQRRFAIYTQLYIVLVNVILLIWMQPHDCTTVYILYIDCIRTGTCTIAINCSSDQSRVRGFRGAEWLLLASRSPPLFLIHCIRL